MLKEILIENFQPWKTLRLDLVNGLNVVWGNSDQGKSAIVRAIDWVLSNRPSGFLFKRWRSKDNETTRVSLVFDKGTVIREKDSEIDQYRLIIDGKEQIFEKLNRQVPDEIKQFLNLDFYNVKKQFDTFFLLQDSPGEVGRKFNEIVNLELIDDVLKSINSIVSEAKIEKEKIEKEKNLLKNQIESMSYIDKLKIEVDNLWNEYVENENLKDDHRLIGIIADIIEEKLEDNEVMEFYVNFLFEIDYLIQQIENLHDLEAELNVIQSIVSDIEILEKYIQKKKRILNFSKDVSTLEKEIGEVESESNSVLNCEMIVGHLELLYDDLSYNNEIIQNESEVEETIEDLIEVIRDTVDLDKISNIIFEINNHQYEIVVDNKKLKYLEEEYAKMIKEGGICEKCGSILDEKTLRERI